MEASESKRGDLVHNVPEARLLERLASALILSGLPGVSARQGSKEEGKGKKRKKNQTNWKKYGVGEAHAACAHACFICWF